MTTALKTAKSAQVQSIRSTPAPAAVPATPSPQGHLARAVALHLAGNREEALRQLEAALKAGETSAEIYRAMGHIQFEMGSYEDSGQSYRSLLKLKPQYGAGWFNLAISLER